MSEEVSQYEQFRLLRLGAGFDDENNSAHFSLKDSNLNFIDRVQLSSARSSPQHPRELLQEELATQRKMYSQLEQRHNALLQKYKELEAVHEETLQELASRDAENSKLRETLMMRKELQRETKKKLKEWVAQAKKGLNE